MSDQKMSKGESAIIEARPWKGAAAPKRILAIRLQAMGDVVITLPYLQHLKRSLPANTVVDLLTREETSSIPESIRLFDHVYAIGGGRDARKQYIHAALLLPRLWLNRYDAILDLQNNRLSRLVRGALRPKAWTAFDRYSPRTAGERNRLTIEALGLGGNEAMTGFKPKSAGGIDDLLRDGGYKPGADIVVLNPAGAFENRNWPVDRYIDFARLWLLRDPSAQFLIMGVDKIAGKARLLEQALGDGLINLVNRTSAATAFAVLQRARFVLSEDSGLMHMAWVSGIPTLALFGSTRSDWSRPIGPHTDFLDSSDMACGNCMREDCLFSGADRNLCMTRHSADAVFSRAMQLLDQAPGSR